MIEVNNLTKTYQTPGESVQVLAGLNLKVTAGEALAIIGPSGCGKTTLLNLLGALDLPDTGSIRINGEDITRLTPEQASRFRNPSRGFFFQQHH